MNPVWVQFLRLVVGGGGGGGCRTAYSALCSMLYAELRGVQAKGKTLSLNTIRI